MLQKKRFKTIAFVSLNNFFTAIEKALHPELRNIPIVVLGDAHKSTTIASANPLAQSYGITTGMHIAAAKKKMPQLTILRGSLNTYQQFSEEFFRILSQSNYNIEPISLYEAFIDLDGFEKQWIAPEEATRSIQNDIIKELEIECSFGIAQNKIGAHVAALVTKPGAIEYVPHGQVKNFIGPLSVSKLPSIGPRTASVLKEMGIHTIEQLAKLPQHTIIQTFGVQGIALWQMANALDNRNVNAPGRTKSISRSISFGFSTGDHFLIKLNGKQLLSEICSALAKTKRLGQTISVHVHYKDGRTMSRQKKMIQATNQLDESWNTANLLLHQLMQSNSEINMISVALKDITYHTRQTNLFDIPFYRLRRIRNAVDKTSRRFGFVLTPQINKQLHTMPSIA